MCRKFALEIIWQGRMVLRGLCVLRLGKYGNVQVVVISFISKQKVLFVYMFIHVWYSDKEVSVHI